MIKSFNQYMSSINESKLYIWHRKFKIYNLLEAGIYRNSQVKKWMSQYDLDEHAHCLFITKQIPKKVITDETSLVRRSHYDIKNKTYFDSSSKNYIGYIPEDSKLTIDGDEVYLYIFKKNSNINLRARQIHGFIYEGEVKKLNGLSKLSKTHKWDAEGGLDKNYLQWRLSQNKNIELYNGVYSSLIKEDEISGIKEIEFDKISKTPMCEWRNWSIKFIGSGKHIEFGDFKRISGFEIVHDKLKFINSNEKYFILAVGFHDNSSEKNILSEYIVLVPVEVWKTYLPDIESNKEKFEAMYQELGKYRLKGQRTVESELDWQNYINKWRPLTEHSLVKLRFKRDSKGQLRIQSAISSLDFKEKILQNPHIRIL